MCSDDESKLNFVLTREEQLGDLEGEGFGAYVGAVAEDNDGDACEPIINIRRVRSLVWGGVVAGEADEETGVPSGRSELAGQRG